MDHSMLCEGEEQSVLSKSQDIISVDYPKSITPATLIQVQDARSMPDADAMGSISVVYKSIPKNEPIQSQVIDDLLISQDHLSIIQNIDLTQESIPFQSDSDSDSDSDSELFVDLIVNRKHGSTSSLIHEMPFGLEDYDEDGKLDPMLPPKTANEINPSRVPMNFELEPTTPIEPIGAVLHILPDLIVIESKKGGKAWDLDSIVCLEDRTVVGVIFETFGPVNGPFYSVRMSTIPSKPHSAQAEIGSTLLIGSPIQSLNEQVIEQLNEQTSEPLNEPSIEPAIQTPIDSLPLTLDSIQSPALLDQATPCVSASILLDRLRVGLVIFCALDHSSTVHPDLLYAKGYDASNQHDEEVADFERDFSDDEKEMAYKMSLKLERRLKNATFKTTSTSSSDYPMRKRDRNRHLNRISSHMDMPQDHEEDEDDNPFSTRRMDPNGLKIRKDEDEASRLVATITAQTAAACATTAAYHILNHCQSQKEEYHPWMSHNGNQQSHTIFQPSRLPNYHSFSNPVQSNMYPSNQYPISIQSNYLMQPSTQISTQSPFMMNPSILLQNNWPISNHVQNQINPPSYYIPYPPPPSQGQSNQ